MFLVLDEDAERQLLRAVLDPPAAVPVSLAGLEAGISPGEELIVLRRQGRDSTYGPASGAPLPCYGLLRQGEEQPSYPEAAPREGSPRLLLLEVSEGDPPAWRAVYFSTESAPGRVCDFEVVRLDEGLYGRTPESSRRRSLAQKIVAVIGVGSRGSLGALELVRAGVESLHLVDFDRLRAAHVPRHLCGVADLGRFKTRAARDALLRHNPRASIVCHQVDITENTGLLDQIAQSSDLMFVATGNEESSLVVNAACLAWEKPAVYGDDHTPEGAGKVIRVVPGETGCYSCVRRGAPSSAGAGTGPEPASSGDHAAVAVQYGDGPIIAAVQATVALSALLRDPAGASPAGEYVEANLLVRDAPATAEAGWLPRPFLGWRPVLVPRDESCPACGGPAGSGSNSKDR